MTTVTLPTVPPPQRYTVAPGRSLAELTAWYGPLPLRRRRVPLADASNWRRKKHSCMGHGGKYLPGWRHFSFRCEVHWKVWCDRGIT